MRSTMIAGLTAVLVLAAPCRAGSYTYKPLGPPGAANVLPTGINDSGAVVGWTFAIDPTVADSFIYSGGTYTPYNVPGAQSQTTILYDTNNLGQLVGSYTNILSYGFYDDGTTVHSLIAPGGGATSANGVNDHGVVVGSAISSSNPSQYVSFAYQNGSYTPIADPNGVSTVANAVNNAGTIVGYYTDANNVDHAFILQGGQFTTVDNPGAGTGPGEGTAFGAINNTGAITGDYVDANLNYYSFVYQNGQYTILNDPGALQTIAAGINDQGDFVGSIIDANGYMDGFLATPTVPEPSGLALLAVAGLAWTGRRLFKKA